MSSIPYEVDYLQVGDGEKSGDAIALRFGNLTGPRSEQTVVVIDGGTADTGDSMVSHIRDWYGGTDEIDYVISTHPDSDHACGLKTILEKMKVGVLLMHRPWEHAGDVKEAFSDGRWTERGLGDMFEKSIRFASDLESIAKRKGVQYSGAVSRNSNKRWFDSCTWSLHRVLSGASSSIPFYARSKSGWPHRNPSAEGERRSRIRGGPMGA